MDDKQIGRILRETAQLLEIDGAIIGRYRGYEKAAELIDSLPESIEQLVKEPEKLEELPGIGERMVEEVAVGTSDVIRRIPPDECCSTLGN
jgi:DNA polymerase/3'-5' exonuclease PolX